MQAPDDRPRPLALISDLAGSLVVLALGAFSLSVGKSPPPTSVAGPGAFAPADLHACVFDRSGYIHGQTYGAISMRVDWTGEELACGGMVRPDARGVRLVFAAPTQADDKRVMFVIGIDGSLEELLDRESAANLTIIDEASGRFFGTRGMDRCWTQIRELEELSSRPRSFRINGDLYCAGSIPSLSDNSSVTLSDFHYSGRMTLDES